MFWLRSWLASEGGSSGDIEASFLKILSQWWEAWRHWGTGLCLSTGEGALTAACRE